MGTKLKLMLNPAVAGRLAITSHTIHQLTVECPNGATANTSTGVSTGTDLSVWQMTPGNATGTDMNVTTPSTTPNGNGWMLPLDYKSDQGLGLANATNTFKLKVTVGSGCTYTIYANIYKISIGATNPATSISSSTLLASLSFAGVTSATSMPLSTTFTPTGAPVSIGTDEYLYVELFAKQTVSGTTHTVTVEMGNGSSYYWETVFDDSGSLTNKTSVTPEAVQWNNKIAVGRNKWGTMTFIKDIANDTLAVGRNALPTTATSNSGASQFQVTAAASIRNMEFESTPSTMNEDDNNPICQRLRQHSTGSGSFGSPTTLDHTVTTWYGMPYAIYGLTLAGASSTAFSNLTVRLGNKNTSSNADESTDYTGGGAMNMSTSAASADGWMWQAGTTTGWGMVMDRHRAVNRFDFSFQNDGTNLTNVNSASLIDAGNPTATAFLVRGLIFVDATANVGTTLKNKLLNNYNDVLNGPPALSHSTGSATANADTTRTEASILNGFDYEAGAYSMASSGNTNIFSLTSLTSYAMPFRCFIITGYTASTAPVVGTNAVGFATAFTELDTGVTVNTGLTVYKGTNYASYVDTGNQIAYVVIFGEQAANTTKYYKIADALSVAWSTGTLSESITLTNTLANKLGKVSTETVTSTEATPVFKLNKLMSEAVSLTEAIVKAFHQAITGEAISTADALVKYPKLAAFAESISQADTIAKKPGTLQTDTVSSADVQTNRAGKLNADTVSSADTLANYPHLAPFAEGVSSADANTQKPGKVSTESISTSDAKTTKLGKLMAEAVSLVEAITKAFHQDISAEAISTADTNTQKPKTVGSESISTADAIGPFNVGKLLAFTVSLSDTFAAGFHKALSEAMSVVDDFATLLTNLGTLTMNETIGVDDTKTLFIHALLAEALSMVDAPLFAFRKALSEALTASDTVTNGLHKLLNDASTLLDNIGLFNGTLFLIEAITLTDVTTKKLYRLLAEAIGVMDVLALAQRHVRSYSEGVTVTDTMTRLWHFLVDFIVKSRGRQLATKNYTAKAQILDYVLDPEFTTVGQILTTATKALVSRNTVSAVVAKTLIEKVKTNQIVTQTLTPVSNEEMHVTRSVNSYARILTKATQTQHMVANVFNTVGVDLTEVSGVRVLLSQTLIEKAKSQQHIPKDFSVDSQVLGILTKTLVVKNQVMNITELKTVTEKAKVRNAVGVSLITKVGKTANAVGQDLTSLVNGVAHLATTFTLDGQVLTKATQSLTEKAKTNVIVAQTLIQKSNVLAKVTQSIKEKANVAQVIFQRLMFKQSSQQLATRNLVATSNTAEIVAKALIEKAQVRHVVQKNITADPQVNELVGVSLTTKASGVCQVTKNLTAPTNTREAIQQHLIQKGQVLAKLRKDYSTQGAQIAALAGVPLTGRARVAAILGKNHVVKTAVRGLVAQSLIEKSPVDVLVGKNLTSVAYSNGLILKQMPSFTTISKLVGKEFTLKAKVAAPIQRHFAVEAVQDEYTVTPYDEYTVYPGGYTKEIGACVFIDYSIKR